MPLILPFDLASSINKLSPSMTSMNSRGDNGHPCLMPQDAVKKQEGEPLTRREKIADEIQPKIQFTPTNGTPIYRRISLMKVQLTLSNSLVRSNFKMRAHLFLVLIVWRTSCVMAKGSVIWQIFKKPNC